MTTKPEMLKRHKPRVQFYVATEDDTFRSVTTRELVDVLIAKGGEIRLVFPIPVEKETTVMSQSCEYCYSHRGVKHYPDPDAWLCRVCSRLHGRNHVRAATLDDINKNIVILFHTLGLTPHDTDDEEE